MYSPARSTSSETKGEQNDAQVTFRFCSECSNMLYPKEDEDNHKLQFTCRTCQYTEDAKNTCIFKNNMSKAVRETAGEIKDVKVDPTLPHTTIKCQHCHREVDAVFFQSQQRSAETGMRLFYVCSECSKAFQTNPKDAVPPPEIADLVAEYLQAQGQ